MASKTPTIEVFQSAAANKGDWYWRLRAKNGEIVLDSAEGYSTKGNARRAARRVKQIMTEAVFA